MLQTLCVKNEGGCPFAVVCEGVCSTSPPPQGTCTFVVMCEEVVLRFLAAVGLPLAVMVGREPLRKRT